MFLTSFLGECCSPFFFVLEIINLEAKQTVCVIQEQEQRSEEKTPLPNYSLQWEVDVAGSDIVSSQRKRSSGGSPETPFWSYLRYLACRIRDLLRHDRGESD